MLSIILDAQAAIRLSALLLVLVVVGCCEVLWPCRTLSISKLLRWSNNWALSALNSLVLYLVFPMLGVAFALLMEEEGWGLFNAWHLPFWLSIPLFVLIFDCAIYWQHRLYHWLPLLWRFHRMHHADPDFDVSTGIRFHPMSTLLSMIIKLSIIALFGPAAVAVLLSEVVLNVTAMFNHGNIAIPARVDKWLRLVLVTPDMHRLHHSVRAEETNSNFGFNFPWWDRMFGSYRAQPEGGHTDMEIGVRGFQAPREQMLDRLLIHPWSGKLP